MRRTTSRRGFTIIEIGFALFLGAGMFFFFLAGALISARRNAISASRLLREQTQLRSIAQSLILFADQNNGRYPLPSLLDAANATIAHDPVDPSGAFKNTTANIFSKLIWDGFLPPEMLVSTVENNRRISVDADYDLFEPAAAATPRLALWDPAFAADFTSGDANVSYAHLLPAGRRLALWANTFSAQEACASNRGPEISAVRPGPPPVPAFANPNSNTFKHHGAPGEWKGCVAFNDSHVEVASIVPARLTYAAAAGRRAPDVLFYDEPDDASDTNAFLSIFTKAGPTPTDFQPIWD